MADPRIAEQLEETAPIGTNQPQSVAVMQGVQYRTNNLPWKMTRRRMHNYKRKNHHRNPNNNLKKALTDEIAEETGQRTHKGRAESC